MVFSRLDQRMVSAAQAALVETVVEAMTTPLAALADRLAQVREALGNVVSYYRARGYYDHTLIEAQAALATCPTAEELEACVAKAVREERESLLCALEPFPDAYKVLRAPKPPR